MNQTSGSSLFISGKKVWGLIGCVILAKLLLLPFVQTVDADAVIRTFFSEDWLNKPTWIMDSVWGPFHFYLTGCMLAIWNNQVYAPILMNILLSALMLLPFYSFVKREFNSNGAFVATCFLAISPIIFRNSLMNMSETPYLLLIITALNFTSKGLKDKKPYNFILAGLSATVAAGFRFEAWFFVSFMLIILLLKKEKRNAMLFVIVGALYPAIYLISNLIRVHYSLPAFFSSYPWNLDANRGFDSPHFEDYLRRIWFTPFCWFISLGPAAFISIKEILFARKRNTDFFWCAILFWAFFLLTEFSAIKGAAMLHPRFTATITLLSLPFIAPYFKELSFRKIRIAALLGTLTIGMTFVYNISDITPVPRLTDQNGASVAAIIEKNITPKSGLIIDFWGWENTYYIALQAKLVTHTIYLVNGNAKNQVEDDKIDTVINTHPQGIIVLARNSLLWQNTVINANHLHFKFSHVILSIQEIYSSNDILVWKYTNGNQ